jgi:pimeloyl-ACP methyl ester carboxylesterase
LNLEALRKWSTMLLLSGVCGCASLQPAQNAATEYGSFSYSSAGSGSPVVVFESGLGNGREAWRPLFADVGKFASVFAYDRGGYGDSRATAEDRSAREIVEELRALLKAAQVPPPYVLVGHSIGGLYANLFARMHPDEIAGVVLVDARPPDFSERCKAAGALVCAPPAWLMPFVGGGSLAEYKWAPKGMQQVRDAPPFPPVPLVVVTGTNKPFEGKAFNQLWLETQAELSRLSPNGRHVICDHCGHYVHEDDPALVVEAIRDVVERSRLPLK